MRGSRESLRKGDAREATAVNVNVNVCVCVFVMINNTAMAVLVQIMADWWWLAVQ